MIIVAMMCPYLVVVITCTMTAERVDVLTQGEVIATLSYTYEAAASAGITVTGRAETI